MTEAERIAEAKARYLSAMHAVQSGVRDEMELGISTDTSPKHLRTGINAAMVEHAGLALLLMEKGIVTELEYYRSLAKAAEREQVSYEDKLSAAVGKKVSLS